MLTTAAAREAVLAAMPVFPDVSVSADKATGRILRQVVCAERDQPPFDRVMMDGIALLHANFAHGARDFEIQATQAAGDAALTLEPGKCIEIMTGASLPLNADCVIPVERLTVADGVVEIESNYAAKAQQFIHARGSDYVSGAQLLTPGKRLTPMDIAIIASCGLTDVVVARDPVMRVISTGNELVPAGDSIEAHQIRLSNGPAILSMLGDHGYDNCSHDHLPDDIDVLRNRLATHLSEACVLILSGGVSMGKADHVPAVLADLGVEVIFHKVSQRPGKPLWFGKGPDDQVVFALPGNPVSALVCCRQYVIPALSKASSRVESAPEFATLAASFSFKPDLTCFLPVRLISNAAGQVLAMPVETNTSGDFAALSASDGYVELPREQTDFDAGTPVFLHRWFAA